MTIIVSSAGSEAKSELTREGAESLLEIGLAAAGRLDFHFGMVVLSSLGRNASSIGAPIAAEPADLVAREDVAICEGSFLTAGSLF